MGVTCEFFIEKFNEYLSVFCASLKNQRTAIEYCRCISLICTHFKKDFLEITRDDAITFFSYMENRVALGTLKKSTVNSRNSCYNKVANFITERYPDSGYANAFATIPSMRGVKNNISPSRIPSMSDIDALLSHAPSSMYYLIFCLAFRVALSASDIIGLKAKNVQKIDDNYCIHYPAKNKFSPDRVVVLPRDIESLLSKYISELSYLDEEGHLFYNEHKNPLTLRNLDAAFERALKASEIKERYTLKDFRSRSILDMVSATIKNGVDTSIVGPYVGIKDLRLETYVSAHTIVNECLADLVNIQIKAP